LGLSTISQAGAQLGVAVAEAVGIRVAFEVNSFKGEAFTDCESEKKENRVSAKIDKSKNK